MALEIPFAFEIGGKPVDPANVTDAHVAEVLQEVVDAVVNRVEEMRCPLHKEPPRFIFRGETVDDLSLEVIGCCDALVDMVKSRLAN